MSLGSEVVKLLERGVLMLERIAVAMERAEADRAERHKLRMEALVKVGAEEERKAIVAWLVGDAPTLAGEIERGEHHEVRS